MGDQVYLEIGFGQQQKILKQIKLESKLTWENIANILEIKKRMIYCYLNETSRLPIFRLNRLYEEIGLEPTLLKNAKLVKMKNYEPNTIKKPDLGESFAEFLGILSGDGNSDPNNYRVDVSCDAVTDLEYIHKIVHNKFIDLFGLPPSIYIQNNNIHCRVYSKELVDYLELFGFPKGKRKNKTFIPKTILAERKFLVLFIRGVFDTDGSFHRKRQNSAVVEFISCSPNFLKQIKNALVSLDFKASLSGKSVYIYDQEQVDTFFNVVKPNNPKHTTKYAIFKETGCVPLYKELFKRS